MFHRRPLDTIWHRLPIRHVSFKRRKQSMKDTRKIERSPRFPPPPLRCFFVVRLWGFLLAFCCVPDVHPGNRGRPGLALTWGGPCPARALPVPFSRCPQPRCGARSGAAHPPRLPAAERFGVFIYLFSLRKGVKRRNVGLPAAERCSQAQPLRGCGAGTAGPGGSWPRPRCGRARCARAGTCGDRRLFGGTLPLAWGPAQFPQGMRGRRAPGALSETRK